MQLTEDSNTNKTRIKSYAPGEIKVNERDYHHSVILTLNNCLEWQPREIAELKQEHFDQLLEHKPDILLIGTGEKHKIIQPQLLSTLHANRIGVEVMSSPSACRTFSILSGENRNVVAAIII